MKLKVITTEDTPLQIRCSCRLIRDRKFPDILAYKMPVSENSFREAYRLFSNICSRQGQSRTCLISLSQQYITTLQYREQTLVNLIWTEKCLKTLEPCSKFYTTIYITTFFWSWYFCFFFRLVWTTSPSTDFSHLQTSLRMAEVCYFYFSTNDILRDISMYRSENKYLNFSYLNFKIL